MKKRQTKQLGYWQGKFGNEYVSRNADAALFETRRPFFQWLLATYSIRSVLEIGCNIGGNLHILQSIDPKISITAVEPNSKAATIVSERLPKIKIFNQSVFDCQWNNRFDLVYTTGVLIHIANQDINEALTKIYTASRKYILTVEYYSPKREKVEYRGLPDALFRRPYDKEWLRLFPNLSLVASGDRMGKLPAKIQPGRWWLFEKAEK